MSPSNNSKAVNRICNGFLFFLNHLTTFNKSQQHCPELANMYTGLQTVSKVTQNEMYILSDCYPVFTET